jgi:hypothetical protein
VCVCACVCVYTHTHTLTHTHTHTHTHNMYICASAYITLVVGTTVVEQLAVIVERVHMPALHPQRLFEQRLYVYA